MTAITISGLADGPYAFKHLGVLRKQEQILIGILSFFLVGGLDTGVSGDDAW